MQTFLRKSLIVSGLALGAAVIGQSAVAGPDDTLRWQSVIGIARPNNVGGLALAGGNSVVVDTPLVELSDQGNARYYRSVGALPSVCASEPDIAFLIRVGSGRWIANGTVLR